MKRISSQIGLVTLFLVGCGDDPASGGGTDSAGGTAADGLDGDGPDGDGPDGDGPDGDGPDGDGPDDGQDDGQEDGPDDGQDDGLDGGSDDGSIPPPDGTLAGGIAIDDIEVNQGVGITIADAGMMLATDSRIAPVIGGRAALVRASYTLQPDFAARPIVGRLWLRNAPDDNAVYIDERMVSGPGDWNSFDGTFQWIVDAEDLTGDSEFRVQFLEQEDTGMSVGDTSGSELPAGNFAPMDAWGDRMVLDVMLVPFTCGGFPDLDLSPTDIADFEGFLFNTYPVQELNLTVHEPVQSNSCSEFDAAEFDLPDLRAAEGADPWVYYGGLMPGNGGGYSIAIEGGDQMNYLRTFASHAWRDYGLTFDLYGHELGHNHGRDHSFEDGSYPGDTSGSCGSISTYGWGPRSTMMPSSGFGNDLDLGLSWFDPNEELLVPTQSPCGGMPEGNRYNFNDMMSYVYPYWVSAYTYAAAAERIRVISGWSGEQAAPPPSGTTLRMVFGPEGDIHRSSRPGTRAVNTATAWAQCQGGRFAVEVAQSTREIPRAAGGMDEFVYRAYELSIPDRVDPSTCRLDTEHVGVRFVAD